MNILDAALRMNPDDIRVVVVATGEELNPSLTESYRARIRLMRDRFFMAIDRILGVNNGIRKNTHQ
jgi:hypothetical protein